MCHFPGQIGPPHVWSIALVHTMPSLTVVSGDGMRQRALKASLSSLLFESWFTIQGTKGLSTRQLLSGAQDGKWASMELEFKVPLNVKGTFQLFVGGWEGRGYPSI